MRRPARIPPSRPNIHDFENWRRRALDFDRQTGLRGNERLAGRAGSRPTPRPSRCALHFYELVACIRMGGERYFVVDLDVPGIARIAIASSEVAMDRGGVQLIGKTNSLPLAERHARDLFQRTGHWCGVVDRSNWALVFDVGPGFERRRDAP